LVIKIEQFPAKDSVMKEGAKCKTDHGNPRQTRTFMISLGSDGIQEVVGSIPISSTVFPPETLHTQHPPTFSLFP
jgi:hypothetical protein